MTFSCWYLRIPHPSPKTNVMRLQTWKQNGKYLSPRNLHLSPNWHSPLPHVYQKTPKTSPFIFFSQNAHQSNSRKWFPYFLNLPAGTLLLFTLNTVLLFFVVFFRIFKVILFLTFSGNSWIGWDNELQPVKIGFQFDGIRRFQTLTLHVNNLVSEGVEVSLQKRAQHVAATIYTFTRNRHFS